MNCPHCRFHELVPAGSYVTLDGSKIVTNLLCTKCCYRTLSFAANPRYTPMVREHEQNRPRPRPLE